MSLSDYLISTATWVTPSFTRQGIFSIFNSMEEAHSSANGKEARLRADKSPDHQEIWFDALG